MLTTRYILDEAHLSHYDERLKSWASSQPVKTIPSSLYPWAQTDKAGAVSCWPVGGTELKPTVDFIFAETGPASGDKGPDNPSTITGVSSVTLSYVGKNLLAYNFPTATVENGTTTTINGLTVTNTNGIYSISGTATKNTNVSITNLPLETVPLKIMPGTYTLSGYTAPTGAPAGTNIVLQMARNGVVVQTESCANGSSTFTLTGDTPVNCNVYIRTASGATYPSGFVCTPQLEQGSEATVFEPSYVTSYSLPLGNTYYGGTLDVASGVMTVTHWGHAFNGTETWRENGTVGTNYRHWVRLSENGFPDPVTGSAYQWCSHCTYYYSFNGSLGKFFANSTESGGGVFFDDKDAVYSSTESWVDWLASEYAAGHPVVVVYQLDTFQTVQLTPTEILSLTQTDKYTPRLNTVYTDASSVQVGYVKSPIREEQELTQAIAAQGGNI